MKIIIGIAALLGGVIIGTAEAHSGYPTENNDYSEAADAWNDATPIGYCDTLDGSAFTAEVRLHGNDPVLAHGGLLMSLESPLVMVSDYRFIVQNHEGYHWTTFGDFQNPKYPGGGYFYHDDRAICVGLFPDMVIDGWNAELVEQHGRCYGIWKWRDGYDYGTVRTVLVDGNEYAIIRNRPGNPDYTVLSQYGSTRFIHGYIQDDQFWLPAVVEFGIYYDAEPMCQIVDAPHLDYSDPWW